MCHVGTEGILSWNTWQGNRLPGAGRVQIHHQFVSRHFRAFAGVPMQRQRLPAEIPRNGYLCRFEGDERHGMILFIRETDMSHYNTSFL